MVVVCVIFLVFMRFVRKKAFTEANALIRKSKEGFSPKIHPTALVFIGFQLFLDHDLTTKGFYFKYLLLAQPPRPL